MRKSTFAAVGSLAAILGLAWATPQTSVAAPDLTPHSGEPVLIELFTSQGCSSCPPADRLAAQLDQDEGLVVISRPVDYWDRLGWKDTFASPENSELQRRYARRGLRGYNGVYTPQMVVDGMSGEVGSREGAVRQMVRSAARSQEAAIRLRGSAERGFGVGIAGETNRPSELVLIGVARSKEVSITRGENWGSNLTYTNVLIDEQRIALWSGGTASHVIQTEHLSMTGADRYALVLRETNAGEVLAARWLP